MADDPEERSELEAKLELPTLGLRRRRRTKRREVEPDAQEEVAAEPPEPEPEHAAPLAVPPATEPVAEQPVAEAPAPAPQVAQPVWAHQVSVRQAVSVPTAAAAAEAARVPAQSAPEPVVVEEPEPAADEPTSVIPLAEPDQEPEPESQPASEAVQPQPKRRRRTPSVRLPTVRLSGRVAAVVAGLVVGLTGVLLVYLSEQGCAAVRNTTSCGGAGVVLLVAVVALMVLEGSVMLRAFVVADSLSTSFLGTGLVAVVTMVFLLGVVDRWYMVIVIPLIGAAGYLLSWWVTSHFSNEEPVRREPHVDV